MALLSALDKDSYLMCITGLFLTFFLILVPMNFRNSGQMPLILVREFWTLVIEKSVKSQGILLFMICGNPANAFIAFIYLFIPFKHDFGIIIEAKCCPF